MKKYIQCNQYGHRVGCPHWYQPRKAIKEGSRTIGYYDPFDFDTPLSEKYPRSTRFTQKILNKQIKGRTLQFRITQMVIVSAFTMFGIQAAYGYLSALAYNPPSEPYIVKDHKIILVKNLTVRASATASKSLYLRCTPLSRPFSGQNK